MAINGTLMENAARRLSLDQDFLHDARALSGTITFEDTAHSAYISIFQGQIIKTGDGYNEFGSEFYIASDQWDEVFHDDKRKGIYEQNGHGIRFKGNIYAWAGNMKAFRRIWDAVRDAYLENHAK